MQKIKENNVKLEINYVVYSNSGGYIAGFENEEDAINFLSDCEDRYTDCDFIVKEVKK